MISPMSTHTQKKPEDVLTKHKKGPELAGREFYEDSPITLSYSQPTRIDEFALDEIQPGHL